MCFAFERLRLSAPESTGQLKVQRRYFFCWQLKSSPVVWKHLRHNLLKTLPRMLWWGQALLLSGAAQQGSTMGSFWGCVFFFWFSIIIIFFEAHFPPCYFKGAALTLLESDGRDDESWRPQMSQMLSSRRQWSSHECDLGGLLEPWHPRRGCTRCGCSTAQRWGGKQSHHDPANVISYDVMDNNKFFSL